MNKQIQYISNQQIMDSLEKNVCKQALIYLNTISWNPNSYHNDNDTDNNNSNHNNQLCEQVWMWAVSLRFTSYSHIYFTPCMICS